MNFGRKTGNFYTLTAFLVGYFLSLLDFIDFLDKLGPARILIGLFLLATGIAGLNRITGKIKKEAVLEDARITRRNVEMNSEIGEITGED